MQRGRASRREHNNRLVFERLWRGTFQAVLAAPRGRPRASSHDPNPESAVVPTMQHQGPAHVPDALEPALRTLIAGLRGSCCCRCSCVTERDSVNNNLQVCLPNEEERKSMRSVIRWAHCLESIRRLGLSGLLAPIKLARLSVSCSSTYRLRRMKRPHAQFQLTTLVNEYTTHLMRLSNSTYVA